MSTRKNEPLFIEGIKVKRKYQEDIEAIIEHWGDLKQGMTIDTELSEIW